MASGPSRELEASAYVTRLVEENWCDAQIPIMTRPRANFAAVVLHGRIAVIGGENRSGALLGSFETIDLDLKTSNVVSSGVACWQQQTKPHWENPSCLHSPPRFHSITVAAAPESSATTDGKDGNLDHRFFLIVAGGYDAIRGDESDGKYKSFSEMVNIDRNWRCDLPSMQSERVGYALTACYGGESGADCSVYVVGGHSNNHRTGDNSCHDTVEFLSFSPTLTQMTHRAWDEFPKRMKIRRTACAAVMVKDTERGYDQGTLSARKLVVIGGKGEDGRTLSSVEYYCLATNQWLELPPLTVSRSDHAAVAFGSCIFVVGGSSSTAALSTVEMFDFRTDRWTLLPTGMKRHRSGCAAVVVNGHLVVLGGFDGAEFLGSIEVLKIEHLTCGVGDSGSLVPKGAWCSGVEATLETDGENGEDEEGITQVAISRQFRSECDAARKDFEKSIGAAKVRYEKRLRKSQEKARKKSRVCVGVRQLLIETTERIARAEEEMELFRTSSDVQKSSVYESLVPQLFCPLTHELMVDPVVVSDGHTYERSEIEKWFKRFAEGEIPRSPATNLELPSIRLVRNIALQSMCDGFRNCPDSCRDDKKLGSDHQN